MKNITKKFTSFLLVAILMGTMAFSAYAASNIVSFSLSTGSGSGFVDGASNGKFYSLTKGTADLAMKDSASCASGTYYMTLYKYNPLGMGMGTSCGSMTASGAGPNATHSKTFTIPSDGNKYYFYVSGSVAYVTFASSGTLSQ
jgi:hypothetical protein